MSLGWLFEPRWRAVWFLMLAAGLNFGDRSAMSAVLSVVKEDFALTDVRVSLIGTIFLWSYALGSLFAGSVSDRLSRSKVVIWSLVAWSVVTGLVGLARGYPMLLALRVGLGLSECLFLPAAIALIATYHPGPTRARAMSFITVGTNTGMVIGGSLAGYFADHHGWRSGFWVLGLAGIALAFFSRWMLPATPVHVEVPKQRANWIDAFKYVVRVRSYWVLVGESMLSGLGMWIFFTWLPTYFRETYGMSLRDAGFAGTFMLQVSVVLGVVVGGWISDRVAGDAPHRRMLLYGCFYIVGAPCLLLFLGKPSFMVVAVGISVFSFMRGLAQSNDHPTQCEIVPPQFRATGLGIMNAVATAMGGCGVLLAGYFKAHFGLGAIFATISVCFLAAAALLLTGYRFLLREDIARAQASGVMKAD